jgi:hypothetical protein
MTLLFLLGKQSFLWYNYMMSLSKKEQIKELLGRNLFLSQDIRTRIKAGNEALLEKIFPILEKLDNVQTKLVKSAIEKNPNFFGDLQNGITHEVLAGIIKEEMALHKGEVEEAEAELTKMLATL